MPKNIREYNTATLKAELTRRERKEARERKKKELEEAREQEERLWKKYGERLKHCIPEGKVFFVIGSSSIVWEEVPAIRAVRAPRTIYLKEEMPYELLSLSDGFSDGYSIDFALQEQKDAWKNGKLPVSGAKVQVFDKSLQRWFLEEVHGDDPDTLICFQTFKVAKQVSMSVIAKRMRHLERSLKRINNLRVRDLKLVEADKPIPPEEHVGGACDA